MIGAGTESAGVDLRELRRHPTIRFLVVCLVISFLYVGYGYVTSSPRMTPRLRERLAQNPVTVNILVTSKFPPEEFHIRIYQQVGNMRGVEGGTARLYTVSPSNVRFLARHYWILRLDLAPGDNP